MDRIVWDKPEAERKRKLISCCLSIDLEVGRQDKRIHAFAAVRGGGDTDQSVVFPHRTASRNLMHALAELDELAAGADYLLGHNLINFDLPHLRAVQPTLRLLNMPAVDTLRLNPLAFPRNPYHHLVKHHQDAQIRRRQLNDPYQDSVLTLTLFEDQFEALSKADPQLLTVWHWLTTMEQGSAGFDDFFSAVRQGAHRPSDGQARMSIANCLRSSACLTQSRSVLSDSVAYGWSLAYVLAWMSVAGGDSVVPPWVRHQFPRVGKLIHGLRDTRCHDADCGWCRERHDPVRELKRWFGFSSFRPQPQDEEGQSLQQTIVESAMAGQHVIGILPTGTGKSICYQIPALSRYDKTGALTVVISPLVALMSDQVTGMEARGIGSCVAVNGLLSLPERAEALDRVRLGEISMLIISPEQLRNRAVRKAMDQREIGAWVLDEAHCLSQWGHDFRPDYRYVSRVISKMAGQQPIPPVLCLTATAKPDVIKDIQYLLRKQLDIKMRVFDGGSRRANLIFQVIPTKAAEKLAHLYQILNDVLVQDESGGAIIYCASRRQTEEITAFLAEKDLTVDYFHAGMQPEHKKEVQRRFIGGELDIIVATNAFGMGIDKPNVRLVVHADIPGSLENYLQETGRAGRDQSPAHCILLYEPADVERQFGLSARGRLTRQFIHEVLRALRRLDRKKHANSEVVATVGEILSEEEEYQFERDSLTDDTKVRTSIAWLEDAKLLSREENLTQVFPSSLRINSVEEARRILEKKDITETYRGQLLVIVEKLIEADADEGISTDHLSVSGLNAEEVRSALYHLEHFGIANNDTALTAFVHHGVARGSQKRFAEAERLESLLIEQLREAEPDMEVGMTFPFHLRLVTQKLKDLGCDSALPEHVSRILRSLSADGRGEEGKGSLGLRKLDSETVRVTLKRSWSALEKTAQLRRVAAHRLLEHLIDRLPPGSKGVDLLAETTISHLLQAIKSDVVLMSGIRKPDKLLDHALLWLHEQEIIRLNKGMAVFRPAMTIQLNRDRRASGFSKTEFAPLQFHYDKQIVQIHIMKEYAEIGLDSMSDAVRMTVDYFTLDQADFLRRWLPGRQKEN